MNQLPNVILIPKCLPRALATESTGVRNAVSTYLALKAINPKGVFTRALSKKRGLKTQVYKVDNSVVNAAAQLCKHSPKTVHNHIDWMLSEGLAKANGEELRIASYDDFCKHFGLPHSGRSRYRVTPTHRKLSHILEIIPLKEKKQECKQTWEYKINKEPLFKIELQNVVGKDTLSFSGAVWNSQQHAILTRGILIDENEAFVLMQHRADFEINYKSIAELYGYTGKGSVAYLKRKWSRGDVANIQTRSIELNYNLFRKAESRRNGQKIAGKFGTIIWNNRERKVMFKTCDAIEILNWNEQKVKPNEAEMWRNYLNSIFKNAKLEKN